jgi:hypothetical protein
MEPTKNARIEAVIELLNSQLTLNYAAAARAFQIYPMTLARRYRCETTTQEEANSIFH